ncbi:MAG: CYTH domain-containing protein [Candidatus Colwellbacteria bacterium]|nr:CYTH domain-containing protein [Candidatus Colwellbacteria bacterium]
MAILIFGFSERYQDVILSGHKKETVFGDSETVNVGEKYPLCILKNADVLNKGEIIMIGSAMVTEVIRKRAGHITEEEAALYGSELADESFKILNGDQDSIELSPVTLVKFDLCLNIVAVRRLIGGPEMNFIITDNDLRVLDSAAGVIERFSIVDTYYDRTGLDLVKKDQWLRHRGGIGWQMKLPDGSGRHKIINDIYVIKGILGIDNLDIPSLIKAGYEQFACLSIQRTAYRMGDFLIRTDIVEQDNLNYRLGRISSLVKGFSYELETKIFDFSEMNGFLINGLRSPIVEFIRVNRPDEFAVFLQGGILR